MFRFLLLGFLLPLSLSTASAQITVAPDSLLIALEAGDTGVLSFDITNTGSDPVDYSLGFRRATTPPAARNAGQRSGSTGSGGVQAPYLDGPPAFVAPSLAPLPPARGRQMNGRLFGASEGTQTIAEFDPLTGAVLASIPSPPTASGAGGLAFDGTSLYFSDPFASSEVYELDPATGIVLRSADYSGFSFDALAYGQDALYALDYNLSIIYQLDLDAATATEVAIGLWMGRRSHVRG